MWPFSLQVELVEQLNHDHGPGETAHHHPILFDKDVQPLV